MEEVLDSLRPVIERNKEVSRCNAILERLTAPDRAIQLRVAWVNDKGQAQVNYGYRVQFNGTIGPYKGGLRFHSSVNRSITKFLGFERIFKNFLTSLTNRYEGVLTGKGTSYGGSLICPEAIGFGAVYYVNEMLQSFGNSIEGKTFAVSGFRKVVDAMLAQGVI